jgi:hypothetical protein
VTSEAPLGTGYATPAEAGRSILRPFATAIDAGARNIGRDRDLEGSRLWPSGEAQAAPVAPSVYPPAESGTLFAEAQTRPGDMAPPEYIEGGWINPDDPLTMIGRGAAPPSVNGRTFSPISTPGLPAGQSARPVQMPMDPSIDFAANNAGTGMPAATAPALSMADRRKAALESLGPQPQYETTSPTDDLGMALLRGGLRAMQAGGRPGATWAEAIGAGGEGALDTLTVRQRERREVERQRTQDQRRDAISAAGIANQDAQLEQGDERLKIEQQKTIEDAKRWGADQRFKYANLRATLADHAANRESQREIAELSRETQRLVAAASSDDRRATAELSAWRDLDTTTLRQAERAVENLRNTRTREMANPMSAGKVQPPTPEEEQAAMNQVFMNSPGSSQYIQLKTEQIVTTKKSAEENAKRDLANDPQKLKAALDAIDKWAADSIKSTRQSRPRLRSQD